jgi:hypothetical protein
MKSGASGADPKVQLSKPAGNAGSKTWPRRSLADAPPNWLPCVRGRQRAIANAF